MRSTTTKKRPRPELADGSVVDGYVVEGTARRQADRELVYDAVGPDGDAVSLVIARVAPADPQVTARFQRWGPVRAALRHPALLPVRAVGTYEGRPYLATARYPQETLADLAGDAQPAPEELLRLLAPVCEALDRSHARGLVHQDLSSASLLVDEGRLLLDGFGVAGGPPQPIVAQAEGTQDLRYVPPEELEGAALQPASNVFSLAGILERSLRGESSGVVIARGLAANPAHRPASARLLLSEVADALGVSVPGLSVVAAPRAAEPPPIVAPAPRLVVPPERPAAAPTAASPAAASPVLPPEPRPVVPPEAPRVAPAARSASRPRAAAVAVVVAAAVAGLVAGIAVRPFESESSAAAAGSADAGALNRLDERRVDLRAQLSSSETPQEQAAAAAELAAAYGQAARTADSPQLAAAARAAERAYSDLAAAGEAVDPGAFWLAEDAVTKAERRLLALAARR